MSRAITKRMSGKTSLVCEIADEIQKMTWVKNDGVVIDVQGKQKQLFYGTCWNIAELVIDRLEKRGLICPNTWGRNGR